MAENFDVIGQKQATDFTRDGVPFEVVEVTIETKPSAAVLSFRIPVDAYQPDLIEAMAIDLANRAELIAGL